MTQVKDIMTPNPACCTPDTTVQEAACLMAEHDCGEIPVVESQDNPKPVGVVTDRDICCRVMAEGKDAQTRVADCMTAPCVTVTPETSVDDCCRVLEENQIRRVPVVDEQGNCCGIVAQADIAQEATPRQVVGVVQAVSQETGAASNVSE